MNWDFKNFSRSEFVCKHCGQLPEIAEYHYFYMVFYQLQPFRTNIGRKVIITSGYRCPTHNKEIGGAVRSYHTIPVNPTLYHPCAVDFYVPGLTTLQAEDIIPAIFNVNFCGYHIYFREDDTWICHIDWRGYRARW